MAVPGNTAEVGLKPTSPDPFPVSTRSTLPSYGRQAYSYKPVVDRKMPSAAEDREQEPPTGDFVDKLGRQWRKVEGGWRVE